MALNLAEGRKKYLSVLGLQNDASNEDIKKKYKKLALQHHPDKNPDDPGATETFQRLSQAYFQLTRKYAVNRIVGGCCQSCGCQYCYETDDEEEDFTDEDLEEDDEESYASWFFRKLFVDVFGDFVFQRRFQSRKKPKSQRFTREEEEEDSFFDFIYKKYRDDDEEDFITEEDLKKFHSYDDWLKDRDPKKKPNQRTRKARKKLKMKSDKPKTISKKQQLAEQHRREKEMKEISEELKNKLKKNEATNQNLKNAASSQKNNGIDDAEIMKEVEMQLKENRKNELQSSKITTESTNNKKKKRKALKEIKKQIKEDAIKTLKRDIEKEKSPVPTASTKTDLFGSLNNDLNIKQMGNPAGDRETREQDVKSSILQSAIFGTTPPVNVNKSDKKAELLQRHLKQYNELMKVQPVRHTEKQLTEERIKEKNKQLQKQHKELMELRNTDQIKVDNSLSKRMDDSVEVEFARMKREHLRKQQEMERKRNEEEIKEIQQKKTKPLKSSQPQPTMKWYEKPTQPVKVLKIASSPPPAPTTNVWAERFRQQEATRLPIPSSNEEEEEMLRKVLEMSQMTARQDEERRKYRQQMASKEFIPDQLKRQIEESKQERTHKPENVLPLKPPSNKWTSVVTSNLSSEVVKQDVRYTDPPERVNKILETNYNNLQPNLKIKIPTEKPVHYDEDWTEEIQELDISPKIPNTIEKYVKWSKNAKEQTKKSTDEGISRKSCSLKPRSPIISPSNGSGDKCIQQTLSHRLSTVGVNTTEKDQTSNAWTKNTSNEVHQKGDEDWDLVTDDKWGIGSSSVGHKGDYDANVPDKNQSFYDRTDAVPRQQRYKQKPMKTVSKPEYMEQQRTKLDLNENWVSGFVDDIKQASPENWSCGSTRPGNKTEICTNNRNQTWETQWNRESIMDGKQVSSRSENRSGLINNGNSASEEHWSIGSVNNKSVPSVLSENSSIRIADDIPRIPQNHMNIGATTNIQNSTQFANTKPHVFCSDTSSEKSEVKTQQLSMSKHSDIQKTNPIVQNSLEKQQTCIENWDGKVINKNVHLSLQEKKNIEISCSFEKQEPVSFPSCDVKTVIKQRNIMSDCTGKTIKQGTSGESWEEDLSAVVTPSNTKPMMQNVELKNEQVLSDQPKTTIPGQNVNENFDHRLPVLKNLSTSSEEDVELPSCRLPRLPHIPHRQNSKICPPIPSSVKHANHPLKHEEPTIKQPSSTSKELPTTSQQDLSGLMAGLNMSSASMNLPLGLPPHLAHAYLQFLSSGNTNATGMMPLANMPLLPGLLPMLQNPLMSASPILAYSLQQQQMAAMNIAMATGGMMGMNVPQVDPTTLLRQSIPNGDGQSNRSCEKETIKQYQPPLPNSEVEAPVSVDVKNGDTNINVTNIKCKNSIIPTAAVHSNQNRPLIHDPVKYIPQPIEPQKSIIGTGSNQSEIPNYIPQPVEPHRGMMGTRSRPSEIPKYITQPVEPQRTVRGTGSNQSEIPKYIPQPVEPCKSMMGTGRSQAEIPKYIPQPVEHQRSMRGTESNQAEIPNYIPQPVEPRKSMIGTGGSQAEIPYYIPQPVEPRKSMMRTGSSQAEIPKYIPQPVESRKSTEIPSYSKTPYDLQRKKDQVQAVQDMLSGLRKQPSSLLENSDLDPRPF
ncbi:uncharacterized protein LOC134710190 [Mytilus trossulus]|uniref:uncharacterized protein LOC134710190 n=1 Tax=Mytilus trossulus TaxID=6551 RepID=UPI0030060B67